jgi:hypothetical protein
MHRLNNKRRNSEGGHGSKSEIEIGSTPRFGMLRTRGGSCVNAAFRKDRQWKGFSAVISGIRAASNRCILLSCLCSGE